MDEKLILLKKNKPVISRCTLTANNIFTLYEANGKRIKITFPLSECLKVSRYQDNSWEMTHRSDKTFRFLGEKNKSHKWFETIYGRFTTELTDRTVGKLSLTPKDVDSNDSIYNLVIDAQLTDPGFFNGLSTDTIYTMKIDETGVCLYNESENYLFEASTIKKFGSTHDCFALYMGRLSSNGTGLLALQSKKYHSKVIYDHFNELAEQSFFNVHKRLRTNSQQQQPTRPGQEVVNMNDLDLTMITPINSTNLNASGVSVDTIPMQKTKLKINRHSTINAGDETIDTILDFSIKKGPLDHNNNHNKSRISMDSIPLASMDRFSTVSSTIIPIEVEPRSISHVLKDETVYRRNTVYRDGSYVGRYSIDEDVCLARSEDGSDSTIGQRSESGSAFSADETLTFYEEKYKPKYSLDVGSRRLLDRNGPDTFEDKDNLTYARVKL